MTEIGKAYIQIVPSMQGFGDQVKSTITGQSGKTGEEGGKLFGDRFNATAQSGMEKVKSVVSNTLATAAKVGVAALGAASAAVVGLTKSAVSSYADYEQLVGGVETLFKDSSDTVLQYANNAYKTAGLSANQYMETVTSFSASLLSSLGGDTQKAAAAADKAITDMADNANKMGSSMESIQNAYQGFAKQNYTMLDNLKLGYGGTQSEMERLILDAEKLNSSFKATRDGSGKLAMSFNDIVDAIHIVQDRMEISGTTAAEASKTISGSIAMTKSAWQNLVAGLANPDADIGLLISNLVDSAKTALGNLAPAIRQAMTGIAQLVKEAAPTIAAELPQLAADILPALLSAAGTMVASLIAELPSILQAIGDAIPGIMNTIFASIESILPESLIPAFESLKETINGVIEFLTNLDASQLQTIATIAGVVAAAMGLISTISTVATAISTVSSVIGFMASPVGIAVAAIGGLIAVGVTVAKNWDDIKAKFIKGGQELKQDWENMKQSWSSMVQSLSSKIQELAAQFRQGFENAKTAVSTAMENIRSTITSFASSAISWGRDLMSNFINGIREKFAALRDAVASAASTVKSYLGFSEPDKGPLSNFHTFAPDMMDLFARGILQNLGVVESAMQQLTGIAAEEMADGSLMALNAGNAGAYGVSTAQRAGEQAQTQTNVNISFEGALAPLAMLLQPVIEAETVRLGESYAPA